MIEPRRFFEMPRRLLLNKEIVNLYTFISVGLLSILLKAWVSTIGANTDLESWQIVGDVISYGQTIYDHTPRYNYGPVWGYICGIIAFIMKIFYTSVYHGSVFHLWVALILGGVDLAIAIYIRKIYGTFASWFFLVNAISVIISGSHSQMENLAILFGLVGWYYYLKTTENLKSGIFFGLSLATKHILIFFPLILLLFDHDKKIIDRIKMFVISYAIFFSGFAIELIRGFRNYKEIAHGILKNVIMYRGLGAAFISSLYGLFLENIFAIPQLQRSYIEAVLGVVLIISFNYKFIQERIERRNIYPFYLLVFFTFIPGESRQYMAIPILGLAVYNNYFLSFAVYLMGAGVAFTSCYANTLATTLIKYKFVIHNIHIPTFWDMHSGIVFSKVQGICFLLILAIILTKKKRPELPILRTLFITANSYLLFTILIYTISSRNHYNGDSKTAQVTNQKTEIDCYPDNIIKYKAIIQDADIDKIRPSGVCTSEMPLF